VPPKISLEVFARRPLLAGVALCDKFMYGERCPRGLELELILRYITRDVKLGRGHQGAAGLRHRGSWDVSQYSLLEDFFFSFRILSFTGSPDSILTVLVITRLTTSQTGPLHPATVGFRPTESDRPVGPAEGP
jgi:hypothetical protein